MALVHAECETAEAGCRPKGGARRLFPRQVCRMTGRPLHPMPHALQACQTWANYRDETSLAVFWSRDRGRYRDSKRFRDRFRMQTNRLVGKMRQSRWNRAVSSRLLQRIRVLFFRLVHRRPRHCAVDWTCRTGCRPRLPVRDRYSPSRGNGSGTRPTLWRRWTSVRTGWIACGDQPTLPWPRCTSDLGSARRGVCCRRRRRQQERTTRV